MVLKGDAAAQDDDNLAVRLMNFVARLDPPIFNQTTYAPLSDRPRPTGVFIETKVDSANGCRVSPARRFAYPCRGLDGCRVPEVGRGVGVYEDSLAAAVQFLYILVPKWTYKGQN